MTDVNALYDAALNKLADTCETWEEAQKMERFLRNVVQEAGGEARPLDPAAWFHERSKRLKEAGLPPLDKKVVYGELTTLSVGFQVTQGEVISFHARIKGEGWKLEVELDPVKLVRVDCVQELLLVVEDAANLYGKEHLGYQVYSERYSGEELPECYRKVVRRATESVYVRRAGLCRDQVTGEYLTEGAAEVAESGKKYLRERVKARRRADVALARKKRDAAWWVEQERIGRVLKLLTDYCKTWPQAEVLLQDLRKLGAVPKHCLIFKRQWETAKGIAK